MRINQGDKVGACADSLCEGAAGTAGETDLGVCKHLGAGGRAGSWDKVLNAHVTGGWDAASSTCPGAARQGHMSVNSEQVIPGKWACLEAKKSAELRGWGSWEDPPPFRDRRAGRLRYPSETRPPKGPPKLCL